MPNLHEIASILFKVRHSNVVQRDSSDKHVIRVLIKNSINNIHVCLFTGKACIRSSLSSTYIFKHISVTCALNLTHLVHG